jgi:hypothetical protein
MRSVRKLRSIAIDDEPKLLQGRFVEGVVLGLNVAGKATFRGDDGTTAELRVPRHVDHRWLKGAAALAPVPAIAVHPGGITSPLLWCVFSAPEHGVLDERFHVDAKTIELTASESVDIRTGKSIIAVHADGEVRVRGKNISSRASNLNRIRGGVVKVN